MANEHAVSQFPSVHPESTLAEMFRIRKQPQWSRDLCGDHFGDKFEVFKLPAPIRYLGERQYEVFQMGALIRDAEMDQEVSKQRSFDNTYEFDLIPFQTRQQRSDTSFVVRLIVKSRSALPILRPEGGTSVTVMVVLRDGSAPVEFNGKVIAPASKARASEISMILAMKGAVGDFILNDRKGLFRFGPRGSPTRQTTRSIKQAMYGGAGVTPSNNWLKPILLAHDPFPPLQYPPQASQAALKHIEKTSLNDKQKNVFLRASYMPRVPRAVDRLTICQGPPGTGKSHITTVLNLYWLDNQINFLVTSAC